MINPQFLICWHFISTPPCLVCLSPCHSQSAPHNNPPIYKSPKMVRSRSPQPPHGYRKVVFPLAKPLTTGWKDGRGRMQPTYTVADAQLTHEMQQAGEVQHQQERSETPPPAPTSTVAGSNVWQQAPAEYVPGSNEDLAQVTAPRNNTSNNNNPVPVEDTPELVNDGASTRSTTTTTTDSTSSMTVDEEDGDSFILEEGTSGNSDISYDMIPEVSGEESTSHTEPPAVAPQPPPPAPESPVHSLEWHIDRTRERFEGTAPATATATGGEELRSGVIELEIERGRILSQTPGSGDLITVMHPIPPSSQFDMNYLQKKPPSSWRPSPRHGRLRSDDVDLQKRVVVVEQKEQQQQQQSPKRKWKSMNFELDLDPLGAFKRIKPLNLTCDESIHGNSSDDLSESEASDATTVLIPMCQGEEADGVQPATDPITIKAEPGELPLMLEGRQLFNSDEHTLDATKIKVRECFRPHELGGLDPNGFDFVHWRSNVGVLFGSNLSFFVNELGIMDLKVTTKTPSADNKSNNNNHTQIRLNHQQSERQSAAPVEKAEVAPVALKCEPRNTFWDEYMESRGSYAAPNYLFKHTRCTEHAVRLGTVVELIDPDDVGRMALGIVTEVLGGRLAVSLVRKKTQSFFFSRNSWQIFPIGSAAALGMKRDQSDRKMGDRYENPGLFQKIRKWKRTFKVDAQVEAFDYVNGAAGGLRPATIWQVIRDRVLIVFDDDLREQSDCTVPKSSFWCADDSPLVRPINYHVEAGLSLVGVRPRFNWNRYMRMRNTEPVPLSAFRTRKPLPFRPGMQLEAVDRINPQVMRAATVKAVLDYEIQINYDGFPSQFSVYSWDDSEDLFPAGWCLQNLHVLVVPSNFVTHCSRGFCGDVGNRNGYRLFHAAVDACPYKMPEFMHKQQRDQVLAARLTRYAKLRHNRDAEERGDGKDRLIGALEEKLRKQAELLAGLTEDKDYGPTRKNHAELWKKQVSLLIPKGTAKSALMSKCPLRWLCCEVEEYINAVPQCQFLGSIFVHHDIDGEALLSLSEHDLRELMSLKQGVVTKIYNAIVQLRSRVSADVFGGARSSSSSSVKINDNHNNLDS